MHFSRLVLALLALAAPTTGCALLYDFGDASSSAGGGTATGSDASGTLVATKAATASVDGSAQAESATTSAMITGCVATSVADVLEIPDMTFLLSGFEASQEHVFAFVTTNPGVSVQAIRVSRDLSVQDLSPELDPAFTGLAVVNAERFLAARPGELLNCHLEGGNGTFTCDGITQLTAGNATLAGLRWAGGDSSNWLFALRKPVGDKLELHRVTADDAPPTFSTLVDISGISGPGNGSLSFFGASPGAVSEGDSVFFRYGEHMGMCRIGLMPTARCDDPQTFSFAGIRDAAYRTQGVGDTFFYVDAAGTVIEQGQVIGVEWVPGADVNQVAFASGRLVFDANVDGQDVLVSCDAERPVPIAQCACAATAARAADITLSPDGNTVYAIVGGKLVRWAL